MNTTLSRLVALLMVLSFGAAACGSSDDDAEAAPDSAATTSDGGSSLLDISAPLADGSTIDLSEFAGQDLMLWFWAPW